MQRAKVKSQSEGEKLKGKKQRAKGKIQREGQKLKGKRQRSKRAKQQHSHSISIFQNKSVSINPDIVM